MTTEKMRNPKQSVCLGWLVVVCLASVYLADPLSSLAQTKTPAYPTPPGLTGCTDFKMQINGTPVWVEHLEPPFPADAPDWFRAPATEKLAVNIASFVCTGPCKLALHLQEPVKSFVVRPKHKQIVVTGKDRDFVLELPGPCKLLVEMDSLPPFLIFANPPETEKPPSPGNNTRIFGPGVHEPGLMTLKDNEQVYLAPGAVVYGGFRGNPREAKVFGRGILDGSRLKTWSMVSLNGARNTVFEGIMIRCGKGWQNTLRNCDDITYRNVKILSFVPYGDGLDPVNSRNILIEDCFFRCSDDCMAVKGEKGGPKMSGITVSGCTMAGYTFSDGFTIGFECHTPSIENVTVKNCDILYAQGGNRAGGHSAFSIICDGPADIRNVLFEDLRVEENITKMFELYVSDGQLYVKAPPGHIRNVRVKNVHWNVVKPLILRGNDEQHRVEDVTFEGCTVAGQPLGYGDLQTNAFVNNVVVSK